MTNQALTKLDTERVPVRAISFEKLQPVLRARYQKSGATFEALDALTGLPSGYTSKLLAPTPIKRLGPISLPLLLQVLGVKLVAVDARRPATGELFCAEVRNWQDLQAALRRRYGDLISGKSCRHLADLPVPHPAKMSSRAHVKQSLHALGLKLLAIDDHEALAAVTHRLVRRRIKHKSPLSTAPAPLNPCPAAMRS